MATAEELLSGTAVVDKTLVISNDLRTIYIPPSVRILGVESDDEVLTLNFKMPRYIGNIDLSEGFLLRINYINANGESDAYTVRNADISTDYIAFSWLVGPTATRYKGYTKFSVCLVKLSEDDVVDKKYNTAPASLEVLEGLEVDELIVEEYSDLITQWYNEIFEKTKEVLDKIDVSIAGAARYATIEDALAEVNATDNGNILAYVSCDAVRSIKLLSDTDCINPVTIDKDCVINLNGKTIQLAAGAQINVANSTLTINGDTPGSAIRKDHVHHSSTYEYVISAVNSTLNLNAGLYSFSNVEYNDAAAAYKTAKIVIYGDSKTALNINGCTIESYDGNYPGQSIVIKSEGVTRISKCTINATSGCTLYGITTNNILEVADSVINCELIESVEPGDTPTVCGVSVTAYLLTSDYNTRVVRLDNDRITASSPRQLDTVYGVMSSFYSYDPSFDMSSIYDKPPIEITVNNCDIEADGRSDVGNTPNVKVVFVYAIYASQGSKLYINDGRYWGGRDGINAAGITRIDGGVFGGPQHGGAYFCGPSTHARNATFCCTDGKRYFDINDNGHYGCAYFSTAEGSDPISAYLDHCRFVTTTPYSSHGVVAKDFGTKVYLSNCDFIETIGSMGSHIRADYGETVYIGKYVNYSTVAQPTNPDPSVANFGHGTVDTTTHAGKEFGFDTDEYISVFGYDNQYVEAEHDDWYFAASFGVNAKKFVGDINAALDSIIAMQHERIGGDGA